MDCKHIDQASWYGTRKREKKTKRDLWMSQGAINADSLQRLEGSKEGAMWMFEEDVSGRGSKKCSQLNLSKTPSLPSWVRSPYVYGALGPGLT